MAESKSVKELVKFLQIGARLDLKVVAVEHVLGLTVGEDGMKILIDNSEVLVSLISLLDDQSAAVAKKASLCLLNISADEKGAETLLNLDLSLNCPPLQRPPENIVQTALKFIFDPKSNFADQCCMILCNLSRPHHLYGIVIDKIEGSGRTLDEIVNIFGKKNYNENNAKLHYLGPVLSNLSQSGRVRHYILDKDNYVIQRLLPFTECKDSLIRRGGVVGTLKNCCFESDFHEWLLSDEVDILPRLLLPLAGNEEFDEEDNDKLPLELQYLPSDKSREEDPDIRCTLLEAITKLCAKRVNRELIRNKNAYVILRELHKWEKDEKVLLACENLVNILLRTEVEIGHENLKDVEIPQEVERKFEKLNAELTEDRTYYF